MNEKMPVEKFAIFEMNEVYRKEYGLDKDGVPEGRIKLGFIVAERKNITETAFYKAKKYLEEMLKLLGIRADYIPVKSAESDYKMFEARRSAKIMAGEKEIGIIGEFKNSVRNEFKLAPFLAGFEVDLDEVLENVNYKREISFGERKKEDLTITTTKNYAEVLAEVQAKYPEAEITPSTIYQAEGQETKNITFHIETKQ